MQPTTVVNSPFSTYAQEGVQKEAKAQYVPRDKVDRIPSSTSNLSVRREETPLRKKANLRLKSAELFEESDRVEELLDSANELVRSFSQVKNDKTVESLSEKNEQIRRQLDSIRQKLEPASRTADPSVPDPAAASEEKEEVPAIAQKNPQPEAKVVFETSEDAQTVEEQEPPASSRRRQANNVRAAPSDEKAETKSEIENAQERVNAERAKEVSERAERVADREEIERKAADGAKDETPEDEKVLGELIEEIRQKLIMRSNRREEAYRTAAATRRSQTERDESGPSEAEPEIAAGSEEKLLVERKNLERIKERTNESVRELVSELEKTPAQSLSPSSYRELNSLLDKTLKDIQENRDSLKDLKVRHDEIEQSKDLSDPSREVPAINHREAERIAAELTREPPVSQLKRVQQRITPDAVSQLLF